jgi:hypothetical protein
MFCSRIVLLGTLRDGSVACDFLVQAEVYLNKLNESTEVSIARHYKGN